ncbi:unnamed protein product [Brassica rapa]|uniref:Helicase C-terminal domain-containing protein n=2 Tax=Brassica TaxID=3705 RepID=A0A8D9LWH9_BRACM|nr:unnamed protein product [Brassica napus]CAG7889537.1 unnamed protein product [Brassica rapa]
MLQVGFAEDVEIILERLPEKRQSMMFSAAMPSWIRSLIKKLEILIRRWNYNEMLKEENALFSLRKNGMLIAFHMAWQEPLNVKLYGDISQSQQRERTLAGFRDGHFNIPVAPVVLAFPMSILLVKTTLVINYELPNNTETFVHRTGRTGRAGKKGSAILIYSRDQSRAVKIIERELPSIAVVRGRSMFEGIGGRSDSSFGSCSDGGYGCTSGRPGNRYSSGGSDRSSQSSGRNSFGGGFGSNDGKRS